MRRAMMMTLTIDTEMMNFVRYHGVNQCESGCRERRRAIYLRKHTHKKP